MFKQLASYVDAEAAFSFLRVLEYISVRAGLALLFSFAFCIVFGPWAIRFLSGLQAIQYVRDDQGADAISLAEMHSHKKKTPTMGGLLMLGSILSAIILFGNFREPVLWLGLFGTVSFCAIGFADDYLKVVKKNAAGLSARAKIILQVAAAAVFAIGFTYFCHNHISYHLAPGADATILLLPFLKEAAFNMGVFYIPFAVFVLVAMSNAVNLTDGLDGLAAGVTISATLCFALVAYLVGRVDASHYLLLPYVRGGGELTVLLAALCGACFGFLWFNSHPAQVFMGDTGSMMLGGALGSVALLVKQEFLLCIVGGIFVAEAASVILQVGSYRIRKKRIFRMAPLHHHFERGGLPESKIIARFYIVSALLALAGLVTLKMR